MKECPYTGQPASACIYDDTTDATLQRFNAGRVLFAAFASVVTTPAEVVSLVARARRRGRRRK